MSIRSASKSIDVSPSASARMRRFTSLVTKMVGSPLFASRTSSATIRIRWSAIWLSRSVVGTERAAEATRTRPPLGQRHAVGQPRAARRARRRACRATSRALRPALGRLLLELVDLFEDEDRDDDFVVRELEDRAGIVDQDVGVEDEMFHCSGGPRRVDLAISALDLPWPCRARSSPSS